MKGVGNLSINLAKLIFLSAALIMLLLGVLQLMIIIHFEKTNLVQLGQISVNSQLPPTTEAAFTIDSVVAQLIVEGLAGQPHICKAEIILEDGKVLSKAGDQKACSSFMGGILLPKQHAIKEKLVHSIQNQTRDVGYLNIELSDQNAVENLKQQLYLNLIKIILFATMLSITWVYIINYFAGRPISDVTTQISSIDPKKPEGQDIVLPDNARGESNEITLLVERFNGLLGELSKTIANEKEARQKLIESEAKVNAIVDNMSDVLLLLGEDGTIEFASPSAKDVMGFEPEHFLNRKISEFLGHADKYRLAKLMHAHRNKNDFILQYDLNTADKEGQAKTLSCSIKDATDVPSIRAFIVLVRDVTEEKDLGRQLAQAQKMEALGQLTGGIAHDFNNILAMQLINLEILQDSLKEDSVEMELAEFSLQAVKRGAELIDRLMSFSRIKELTVQKASVNEHILDLTPMLQRVMPSTITLKTELNNKVPPIYIDVTQFENSIVNLFVNAKDAMPEGGQIVINSDLVSLELDNHLCTANDVKPGEYVIVSVSDNGHGIKEEILDKVVQPFFTTKGVGEGSGLGLAMVYGFLEQSGGFVHIASTEGKGTSVNLYFPLGGLELLNIGQDVEPSVIDNKKEDGDQSYRILFVEDEVELCSACEVLFKKMGHEILSAHNADDALKIFESSPDAFDLLITDIMLPGDKTGAKLAQIIRKTRKDIPVVFISGHAEEDVKTDMARVKGAAFVSKPFTKNVITEIIERMMNQIFQQS